MIRICWLFCLVNRQQQPNRQIRTHAQTHRLATKLVFTIILNVSQHSPIEWHLRISHIFWVLFNERIEIAEHWLVAPSFGLVGNIHWMYSQYIQLYADGSERKYFKLNFELCSCSYWIKSVLVRKHSTREIRYSKWFALTLDSGPEINVGNVRIFAVYN